MNTKTNKPKTKSKDPNEERFYRFATALMAVPKEELDKLPDKHSKRKREPKSRRSD